ncbi:hypothetical protein OPV22_009438 [Ensete ventricosum]|uniref:Plastocyanin-like domain-containing protein n=1 Tax=Ensete ventricosum TaxID=4639 RepID=A0AAV8R8V4_ENSVE|nr:hypothetical protein OPV22_009438 [Ensete ventricosum]
MFAHLVWEATAWGGRRWLQLKASESQARPDAAVRASGRVTPNFTVTLADNRAFPAGTHRHHDRIALLLLANDVPTDTCPNLLFRPLRGPIPRDGHRQLCTVLTGGTRDPLPF